MRICPCVSELKKSPWLGEQLAHSWINTCGLKITTADNGYGAQYWKDQELFEKYMCSIYIVSRHSRYLINDTWFNLKEYYSQQYCIIYFKVAKRIDLKCSKYKKEMIIILWDRDVGQWQVVNHIALYKSLFTSEIYIVIYQLYLKK